MHGLLLCLDSTHSHQTSGSRRATPDGAGHGYPEPGAPSNCIDTGCAAGRPDPLAGSPHRSQGPVVCGEGGGAGGEAHLVWRGERSEKPGQEFRRGGWQPSTCFISPREEVGTSPKAPPRHRSRGRQDQNSCDLPGRSPFWLRHTPSAYLPPLLTQGGGD